MEMKDRGDVRAEVAGEHRSLEQAIARIRTLPADDPGRRVCLKRIAVTLAGHVVAVEQVLHPAVHSHVPEGDRLARQSLTDLVRAEEVMKDLEFTDTESGEFDTLLRRLTTWLRRHSDCEEAFLLPHLSGAAPRPALDELKDDLHTVEADAAALREAVAHGRRPDVIDRVHTALTERYHSASAPDRRPAPDGPEDWPAL
ncbi:hemerythrin domain-containing protein [Streptomyces sp. NPDC052309]|uniref:hemerythrin domain-containing protein n=1 Tax=Streptomyces sp. NPDC052309 TaxID=3155421 RepID=UPI0034281549